MRKLFAVLPLLFACQVTGVAAADPAHIIAFGDSNTATRGKVNVYATRLAETLDDVRVTNAGVGGRTTNDGLLWLHRSVLSRKPDIVIFMFGIIDAAVDVWKNPPASKPRVPLYIYEANLRHFEVLMNRDNHRILHRIVAAQHWGQYIAVTVTGTE